MATNTPKLDLLRIQPNWQFGDAAFNRFIDDADDKLVGVSHLGSNVHWSMWEENKEYEKDDVVRITNGKTHQYYQCIEAGTSGTTEPTNDVTGSMVDDGTVKWMVMSLSEAAVGGGTLKVWLSGHYYKQGDAVLYGTSLYRCKVDHEASAWDVDNVYWQEVFSSIRLWKPSIYYFVDDSVVFDGLIYKCTVAHISESTFNSTEESNWEVISDIGGAKVWESNKKYRIGNLVVKDGILYRCITKHTSSLNFSSDLSNWESVNANITEWNINSYYPQGSLVQHGNIIYKSTTNHNSGSTDFEDDRINWVMFHIPSAFIYNWATNTYYYVGQFVIYNDSLYRCNLAHTSSAFSSDELNWDIVYASILEWVSGQHYKIDSVVIRNGDIYKCNTSNDDVTFDATHWDKLTNVNIYNWTPNKVYGQYELVFNDGILYRTTTAHTSGNDFLTDSNNWEIVYSSIPLWASNTDYKVGAIVLKDNIFYRCITDNNDSVFTETNWDRITALYINDWATNTIYKQNELVIHDSLLYQAKTAHTSDSASFIADINKWNLIYSSIPIWQANKDYVIGTLVIRNDSIYRCLVANNDATFDLTKWDRLPFNHIKNWAANTEYEATEVVLYDGVIYRANVNHTSSSEFSTDSAKWDSVYANIREYANNTFYKLGSQVVYSGKIYRCKKEHTSSSYGFNQELVYHNPDWFMNIANPATTGTYSFDIGKLEPVSKIIFYQYSNSSYITYVDCFGSEDGIDYYNIGNGSNSAVRVDVTANVKANIRYIRMNFNASISINVDLSNLRVVAEVDNWELISGKESVLYNWELGKKYSVDDVVAYNGKLYKCIDGHISVISFEQDADKWELIGNEATIEEWKQNTEYKAGDLFIYDDILYRVDSDFISSTTFDDTDCTALTHKSATSEQIRSLFV